MIELDVKSKIRIESPKVAIRDKLYLLSRYVEEKYQLGTTPMYWEDQFPGMKEEDRVFYKAWLWLSYINWESIVPAIAESEVVFGKELTLKLNHLDQNRYANSEAVEKFLKVDAEAGRILLDWATKNLIS